MNDRIIGILEDSFTQLIIPGITATIPLTLISFAFGLAIALFLAIVRTKNVPVLATFARLYVWIFRGTPLLVHLLRAPEHRHYARSLSFGDHCLFAQRRRLRFGSDSRRHSGSPQRTV